MTEAESMPLYVNGKAEWARRDERLQDFAVRMGIAVSSFGLAIAVNGRVIRRSEWPSYHLQAEDRIELVMALQGG